MYACFKQKVSTGRRFLGSDPNTLAGMPTVPPGHHPAPVGALTQRIAPIQSDLMTCGSPLEFIPSLSRGGDNIDRGRE